MASRAASEPRLDVEERGEPRAPLSSSAPPPPQLGFPNTNPFAAPSSLPFSAPPFDLIQDDDYAEAIEEGMRRHLREVAAIAGQTEAPSFDNTFAALERSGQLLTRVLRVFAAVTSANTNERLQAIQTDQAPKLAAHSDAIYLDDALFARVRDVYDRRDGLALNAEQRRLVERYHLDFVRSGARLSADDKARLRELNREEATLTTEFQNRLLEANKAASITVDDVAQLDGLSREDVASAAQLAAERGTPGSWAIAIQNTTQQPPLAFLHDRALRCRLFEASVHRSDRDGAVDTRSIVVRLAGLRAERAALLGYDNAAAYVLDDQMAKTPEAAIALLHQVGEPAAARARHDAARLQSMIDASGEQFVLAPWDWQLYAERLRKAEYELDESEIKPYFELDRVLRDGVFFAANRLYGIELVERHGIPVYHPEVRVFDVIDADGTPIALFYGDFFKRDNKIGGAWMDMFADQSRLLDARPIVYNVTNFTKPAPGQPTLLSFDEVGTLFHEFGHALHGMLSDVEYPMLSGANVPRDFVEFPSQFNEHWALDETVFARYARHHETDEPMPPALVERIKRSRTFNQGFALTEYVSAALLDMEWHRRRPGETVGDIDAFERDVLRAHGIAVAEIPPRYHSTYFAHAWNGGYGAGYYAYLWAEVLDHDAYDWFKARGGLSREAGQRFREMVLSRGGTADPAELYRAFVGRDPVVEPLLAFRGFTPNEM
ncbi:MAG TPA: M3 family metallopeptidase [Gemmatimonadaceae bacterium]|nr:M3 family metallopeptidase [Gemmatimonadaceae bacterium]